MIARVVDRFRSLLDLYSPSLASRIAVLACLAFAAALLAWGWRTGSATAAIPLAVLVWANHTRFLATVDDILERHAGLVVAIPLLVFVSRLLQFPPAATDDLLRHIASAFRPGGYADMYVETALPPAPLYPGFDTAVGALARAVGAVPAMWLVQAIALGGFLAVFLAVSRRLLAGHPMASVLALAALVVVLDVMVARIFLARPEFFAAVWALAAALVAGRFAAVLWCLAGLAMSSAYWLAPVYFPAVLLFRRPARERVAALAVLFAGWSLLWWHYSDGRVVEAMQWTFAQVGHRLPGIDVQENRGIAGVMLMPQMLALVFAGVWAAGRPGAEHRFALLAGWFMVSNQVRYAGVIAPLLAFYALSALAHLRGSWPARTRGVALAIGAVSLSLLAAGVPRLADLPRLRVPEGAVVLTSFSEASYATLFANPGRVRVAPAFEVGAASLGTQRLALGLMRGEIDCAALPASVFTHVIEDRLRGPAPGCLSLSATQGRWRLWRVVR